MEGKDAVEPTSQFPPSSFPVTHTGSIQVPRYTLILVSYPKSGQVLTVMASPVPAMLYHTPGAVTAVPQLVVLGSKVASTVVPDTVWPQVRVMAAVQASFGAWPMATAAANNVGIREA